MEVFYMQTLKLFCWSGEKQLMVANNQNFAIIFSQIRYIEILGHILKKLTFKFMLSFCEALNIVLLS